MTGVISDHKLYPRYIFSLMGGRCVENLIGQMLGEVFRNPYYGYMGVQQT